MKKVQMFLLLVIMLFVACSPETPPQPKNDYNISSTAVTGATTYHFFLEKKSASPYLLTQGMDYLAPSVIALKVGTSATPIFTVNLVNDGIEYKVGVVAQNVAGFYSGMGCNVGLVGIVPNIPGGVNFVKKP